VDCLKIRERELMPDKKHCDWICHCEPFDFAQDKLREAISNATMVFSAYNTEDCHGPAGLAMTDCRGFYKVGFEKTKPILLRHKLMQIELLKRIMKKNAGLGFRKNKANQSQNYPKRSRKEFKNRCQKSDIWRLFSAQSVPADERY